MNSSEVPWLSELGLDDSIFMDHHFDTMDSYDEVLKDFENCLSPDNEAEPNSSSSNSTFVCNNVPTMNSFSSSLLYSMEVPDQYQAVPDSYCDYPTMNGVAVSDQPSSAPIILSFGNMNHSENYQQTLNAEEENAVSDVFKSQSASYEKVAQIDQATKKKKRIRPPSQTYDHIIAERKRREQLSQLFIALSAIVPGLKKTDKSSVLGDAIKYLKHLQERVEALEEQASRETMESTILVRKSHVMEEDEGSSDENCGSSNEQLLPEIEARVCKDNILLRIQCENHKGILLKLLRKIESLDLVTVNTNVAPFGNLAHEITIVVEMEKDFSLTTKEVVTALRGALKHGDV